MLAHLMEYAGNYPGWLALAMVGSALLAYCLGCFNGSVIISRYILKNDVRQHGSGNAGLTNFHRTFGGGLTAAVLAMDMLKMVASVLFAWWIFKTLSAELVPFAKYWAGLFCELGHMFPVMFQFKGGKGVLSGGALALLVDWRIALVVWGGFVILVFATRYVSLGSCYSAASFPVATAFVFQDPLLIVLGIIEGGLVLWKHRSNIKRLVTGTESKLVLRKKKAEPAPAPAPAPSGDALAAEAAVPAAEPVSAAVEAPAAQEDDPPGEEPAAQETPPEPAPDKQPKGGAPRPPQPNNHPNSGGKSKKKKKSSKGKKK